MRLTTIIGWMVRKLLILKLKYISNSGFSICLIVSIHLWIVRYDFVCIFSKYFIRREILMLGKIQYPKLWKTQTVQVSLCVLSCNRLYKHVWNALGRYLLCMNAWHFIYKIFGWIYFIKFPDVSLKYHSDLYSYRNKNQDYVYGKRKYNGTCWTMNTTWKVLGQTHPLEKATHKYVRELLAPNKAYIIIITIIYHLSSPSIVIYHGTS